MRRDTRAASVWERGSMDGERVDVMESGSMVMERGDGSAEGWPGASTGDEDDGRFGDERVQHLLNRSLLVLGRRHVVQLGQPRQVLQQGVDLPPLVGELLVVTHAKLALSCAARRARAGRAGRFAHAELLLVAVLVLLVVRERRASGSRSGEKAAAPQPPGLLLEPLIERDDQSEPESTERRAGGEVEESAHGAVDAPRGFKAGCRQLTARSAKRISGGF